MTVITALIRPQMEGRVVQALHDLPDFPGFFISEARGQGRGRGAGGSYTASEADLTYHRFLQLQMVCPSRTARRIEEIIAAAAWTGRKGDGVIFTSPAQSFFRIREVKPAKQSAHD
jgi:nitrogen regulatory protein PII